MPEKYSYWDLHVALQDAMGWLDQHLHEFRLLDAIEQAVVSIGIPADDEPEDRPVVPGWEVPLSKFFDRRAWHAPPALYAYDFGDDWEHAVVHEGMESSEAGLSYPRCVSGARRCPPEDCGSRGRASVKDDRVYLSHVLRCIARIEGYTAGGRNAFFASHLGVDLGPGVSHRGTRRAAAEAGVRGCAEALPGTS